MQRLTKYSLLLKAVLKKTDDVNQKKDLAEMVRHFRRQGIYPLTGSNEGLEITEKAPIRAFSWLKAPAVLNVKELSTKKRP